MKNLYVFSRRFLRPSQLEEILWYRDDWMFSRKVRSRIIFLFGFLLLVVSSIGYAQAPYQFSYQGVARDAAGKSVSNSNVTVRIKIHKDGPGGNVIFTETQIVPTNSSGIFNLVIGGLAGGLDNVNWGSDNCFLQTEIDVNGGSNFLDMGTTQLKSVPYALASRKWVDNVPIVQTGVIGAGASLPALNSGPNLIWYARKAAFRVGSVDPVNFWEDDGIGLNTFATGRNCVAKGENSIAMGYLSNSAALGSVSIGTSVGASGDYSVAIGRLTKAIGENSTALGLNTYAKSNASISIGCYNNTSDSEGAPLPTDRIFQLGNGSSDNSRSNALTILRNGNVGIGNNVLNPAYFLDLGGRMRIRNNGATAGIHFNNSANNEDGFVGMKTDDEVGLFINGAWRFWVNSSNAYVNNAIVNTSDRRLKERITALPKSLPLLNSLNGYHYYWKNKQQGTELQTGLIAQEVEQYLPELVVTGKDGYKAVNYIGLIPHLIEAVKELDNKMQEIAALKKELASVQQMNKNLSALEANVKQLLASQAATSTPTGK